MKPKVEVETISEREHVLKVDGEIIGVSKTQYDALFHPLSLDETFRERDAHAPGISFDRQEWPHGKAGRAIVHGALFGPR